MDLLDFGLAPLREYLPVQAYDEACRRARRVVCSDGQVLHERGDRTVRLCIIADGAVRLGRFQRGGAFNLVGVIGAGAHFGDVGMYRQVNTQNAYAVGHTELYVLDSAAFEDLLRNEPGFSVGLYRCSMARFNALLELYDDVRTLGITVRLAKVLYVHTGRGALADGVACLQRDLAELLGVTQVSVGAALKELERAKLVKAGYRCVMVPDKEKLKAWLRKSGAA